MNGDSKIILAAVKENGKHISKLFTKIEGMDVTQKLQHKENKDNIVRLIKHDKECSDTHSKTSTHVKLQWFFIGGIFVGIILLFIRSI